MKSARSIQFKGDVVNFGVRLASPRVVKAVKYKGYAADIVAINGGMYYTWQLDGNDGDPNNTAWKTPQEAEKHFKSVIDQDEPTVLSRVNFGVRLAFKTMKTVRYRGYTANILESNGMFCYDDGEPGVGEEAWDTAEKAEKAFRKAVDQNEGDNE